MVISMKLISGILRMELLSNGSLVSLWAGDKNVLAPGGANRPVFTLRLRLPNHEAREVTSLDAKTIRTDLAESGRIRIHYADFPYAGLELTLIAYAAENDKIHFTCNIANDTDAYVEFLEFPNITLPNDLVGAGGKSRIFWPFTEGCVVEDASLRTNYHPIEYPNKGWEGLYPGPVQMQFMSYYDDKGGLYFAAHDPHGMTKGIEYHLVDDTIRLEYRLFLAAAPHATYQMDFPMVLGAVGPGWHCAAEKYRQWLKSSTDFLPLPTAEDPGLPDWYDDAPLVVMYPVRGEKDTGDMSPNDLFPYVNALPAVDRIAQKTGSRILVLLAHWEGTAPWAPPYIWPPYGGEEALRAFTDQLHQRGHLIGLYASGLGWTDRSVLVPYDRTQFREENHLTDIMVADADQIPKESLICRGGIRYCYDMCGYPEKTRQIVTEEIHKVGFGDIDYLQYFDQTIGGCSYLCYGGHHGHPPVPGAWQAQAMNAIFEQVESSPPEGCRVPLLGCEAAAAECFVKHLRFNDARCGTPVSYAVPVPAYSYLFHPYLINFMGNYNCYHLEFPAENNPQSLLYRMAYSFVAGDALTFVIRGNGDIIWNWGTPWDEPVPDQEPLFCLARSMTSLRRKKAHSFLQHGEMQAPLAVKQKEYYHLTRPNGSSISCEGVLFSRWIAPDGTQAQIFANYTDHDQPVVLLGKVLRVETADSLLKTADAEGGTSFTIPAYTAAMALLEG